MFKSFLLQNVYTTTCWKPINKEYIKTTVYSAMCVLEITSWKVQTNGPPEFYKIKVMILSNS